MKIKENRIDATWTYEKILMYPDLTSTRVLKYFSTSFFIDNHLEAPFWLMEV